MTAGEAQYFSEDIIAAGQCVTCRVAFHQISREILSGEENGQSLPTSPDGLLRLFILMTHGQNLRIKWHVKDHYG